MRYFFVAAFLATFGAGCQQKTLTVSAPPPIAQIVTTTAPSTSPSSTEVLARLQAKADAQEQRIWNLERIVYRLSKEKPRMTTQTFTFGNSPYKENVIGNFSYVFQLSFPEPVDVRFSQGEYRYPFSNDISIATLNLQPHPFSLTTTVIGDSTEAASVPVSLMISAATTTATDIGDCTSSLLEKSLERTFLPEEQPKRIMIHGIPFCAYLDDSADFSGMSVYHVESFYWTVRDGWELHFTFEYGYNRDVMYEQPTSTLAELTRNTAIIPQVMNSFRFVGDTGEKK